MKVICDTHGELDKLHFSGYGLGHESAVKPSESDLDGITFVLDIPESRDEIKPDDISTYDDHKRYLSKFANIYEQVADAINVIIYYNNISIEGSCPNDPSNGGISDCHVQLSE